MKYGSMENKRILVTGGAGFVGSNLCERLLQQGHYVICMDNFYTGQKSNISKFINYSNFELITHDITQPFDIKVDQIYNLACPASPIHYQEDAIQTIKTSILGAFNTLEIAKEYNASILQASTSEIYGNPLVHPQIETYWGNVNPIGIRACYDEGKRCAETIFTNYANAHNVNAKIIRIFNTYGPNMSIDDNRVISNFIIQALQNKEITIYGTGNQTRSFQYIDDLIDAMIIMMNSSFLGPFNIGNPCEFSILELAEKIIKLTNSSSKLVHLTLPSDDPIKRKPNIELAKEYLKWSPKVELENGLLRTIEYFKEII
jgi:UDP-glucuronate decarboxylase